MVAVLRSEDVAVAVLPIIALRLSVSSMKFVCTIML